MRRLAFIGAALAGVSACGETAPANAGGCFSILDCGDHEVCFYGRCVDTSFGVTTVFAELKPPSDTAWLEQHVPYPLDLGGFQEIGLRQSTLLHGVVRPGGIGMPVPGEVSARPVSSVIPGRDIVRQANVTDAGFDLQVLPVEVEVSFEPSDDALPPKGYWIDMRAGSRNVNLSYPSTQELAVNTLRGVVRPTDDVGAVSEGARVVGFASNSEHPASRLRSTVATTDANGEFEITFLPEADNFEIRVGPNPGSNENVPEVTFEGLIPTAGDLGDLVLGIDPEQPLVTAVVLDDLDNAVADAHVVFEGSVGARAGRFVVSESSNDAGSVSTTLLAGDYRVTVAPQSSQPYALVTEAATIPNGNELELRVTRKVELAGCVHEFRSPEAPVPGADVTLTRLDSPVPRVFRTITAANGCFRVRVDPGGTEPSGEYLPAEYELTVQPSADAGLPFFRELVQVFDGDQLNHNIELYEPKLVYGMVRDPNGMPLANVIIGFFSLELGDAGEAVLVGVVSTHGGSRAGEFVLPVPEVPRH
jgi:hypothetical protein